MRKRICILAVFAVMVMAYAGTTSSLAQGEGQFIKIGLQYGSGADTSYTINCDDDLMVGQMTGDGIEEWMVLDGYHRVIVSLEGSKIMVRNENGTLLYEDLSEDGCIAPLRYEDGIPFQYENKLYRGGICFYINSNGKMNAINYVSLEGYLYGVLNAEMGYGNPLEALKAQAITARSFTMANLRMHDDQGFDLCMGSHCQVYAGYGGEYTQTNRAVDETAGLMMIYDGEVVSGYYFKNSGGHTQSSVDVWGSNNPYLTGVFDEYSPDYTWQHSLTFAQIQAKLESAGYVVGTISSISIKERSDAGAVAVLEVVGSSGTVELKNEKIRSAFGYENIKSTMFSLGDEFLGNTNTLPGKFTVLGAQSQNDRDMEWEVSVIDADGRIHSLPYKETFFWKGRAVSVSDILDSKVVVQSGNQLITSGPVVFNGKGYGHGIGMSQDGAIAMAKQGFTYEEILKYYYMGIEIEY